MRSHTRYHLVYGTVPLTTPVGLAACVSAGTEGIDIGDGSGAAAKSAKSAIVVQLCFVSIACDIELTIFYYRFLRFFLADEAFEEVHPA